MAILGEAYVQVRADLAGFSAELRAKLVAALKEATAGVELHELDDNMEKAGERAGEELGKGLDKKAKDEADKSGKSSATKFADGFLSTLSTMLFNRITMWTTLITYLAGLATQIGPALVAGLAMVPAAMVGIIGLAGTMMLAFHGVGAAISAAFAGKLTQQQLDALAPAARSFVGEIYHMKDALHSLQQGVQQSFFAGLAGQITLVSHNLLPVLNTQLRDVASSAALALRGITSALATTSARNTITDVFSAMSANIAGLAPLLNRMTTAFLNFARIATPFLMQMVDSLTNIGLRFANWLNAMANSGALTNFFTTAREVMANLGSVLSGLLSIVGSIMKAFQGTDFISPLAALVGVLAQLFKSPAGQQLLGVLAELVMVLSNLALQVLVPLLPAIAQLVTALGQQLANAIIQLTPAIIWLALHLVPILEFLANHPNLLAGIVGGMLAFAIAVKTYAVAAAIAQTATEAWTAAMVAFDIAADANPVGLIVLAVLGALAQMALLVADVYLIVTHWKQITDKVRQFWDEMWGFVTGIGKKIGDFFTVTVPGWFNSMVNSITSFISSLPSTLMNLMTSAMTALLTAIGFGIGFAVAEFFALPGQIISALSTLGSTLANLFATAWQWAETTTASIIDRIMGRVRALPGQASSFLSSLPSMIGNAFTAAWNWAVRETQRGADAVIGFARSLPNKLGNFFSNVGSTIISGLRSGINSVIDGLNSGIDKVGGPLKVILPHIPHLAMGALISSPTLAMIGEAGSPEVVLPTNNDARARQLLEQAGMTHLLQQPAAAPTVYVTAMLGTGKILDVIDQRVQIVNHGQSLALAQGVRA